MVKIKCIIYSLCLILINGFSTTGYGMQINPSTMPVKTYLLIGSEEAAKPQEQQRGIAVEADILFSYDYFKSMFHQELLEGTTARVVFKETETAVLTLLVHLMRLEYRLKKYNAYVRKPEGKALLVQVLFNSVLHNKEELKKIAPVAYEKALEWQMLPIAKALAHFIMDEVLSLDDQDHQAALKSLPEALKALLLSELSAPHQFLESFAVLQTIENTYERSQVSEHLAQAITARIVPILKLYPNFAQRLQERLEQLSLVDVQKTVQQKLLESPYVCSAPLKSPYKRPQFVLCGSQYLVSYSTSCIEIRNKIIIWDLKVGTYKEVSMAGLENISSVIAVNEEHIAVAQGASIHIFNIKNFEEIATLQLPSKVISVSDLVKVTTTMLVAVVKEKTSTSALGNLKSNIIVIDLITGTIKNTISLSCSSEVQKVLRVDDQTIVLAERFNAIKQVDILSGRVTLLVDRDYGKTAGKVLSLVQLDQDHIVAAFAPESINFGIPPGSYIKIVNRRTGEVVKSFYIQNVKSLLPLDSQTILYSTTKGHIVVYNIILNVPIKEFKCSDESICLIGCRDPFIIYYSVVDPLSDTGEAEEFCIGTALEDICTAIKHRYGTSAEVS